MELLVPCGQFEHGSYACVIRNHQWPAGQLDWSFVRLAQLCVECASVIAVASVHCTYGVPVAEREPCPGVRGIRDWGSSGRTMTRSSGLSWRSGHASIDWQLRVPTRHTDDVGHSLTAGSVSHPSSSHYITCPCDPLDIQWPQAQGMGPLREDHDFGSRGSCHHLHVGGRSPVSYIQLVGTLTTWAGENCKG